MPRRSRFAVFVKSPRNVTPLGVVTIMPSLAAPYPICKRPAVNARLLGCVIIKGAFREGVEDKQHELRAKLWGGSRDPRRRFLLLSALFHRCRWRCRLPRAGAVSEQRIGRGHVVFIIAVVSNLRR